MLPAYPLFYMWNIFGNCADNPTLLTPHISAINSTLKDVNFASEDYYLLLLLKGVCMRNIRDFDQAIECFAEILHNQGNIETNTFVAPSAALELGITYMNCDDFANAKKWLEKARDEYTGYLAESLAHLRIHGALQKMKLS